jgi:DNA-directed RNA polymerase subunit RPC12/RpoP
MFKRPFGRGADRRRRAPAAGGSPAYPGSGLHVCAECRSDFVHALERHREGDARWLMLLRCGRCGSRREVIVSDDLVLRFDADVARGLAVIAGAPTTLDHERMAEQADTFAAALQLDLIDAGDFRP